MQGAVQRRESDVGRPVELHSVGLQIARVRPRPGSSITGRIRLAPARALARCLAALTVNVNIIQYQQSFMSQEGALFPR